MEVVKKFLQAHWDGRSPLLLGYSGGPDSKALLYSLIEAGCDRLHLAHVDHGWREESACEAELLRKEAESAGVPFHTTRLKPTSSSNKEAAAREERLDYFRSLFEKIPFQALLLGHQADDLAETVLKRLFEGANLPFLGGMEPASQVGGMTVWRPLLKMRRKEILRFLEERQLKPIIDPTNRDPSFLRSRLREETLPFLNRSFGKEIAGNLVRLSERAHELKRYLDRKIADRPIEERGEERGAWGAAVFCGGLERIEARHLLQKMGAEEGVSLPRTVLEPVLDWVEEGALHRRPRKIFLSSKWVVVRQGWVFFLESSSGKALPEKGLVRKLSISFAATRSNPDE